MRTAYIGMGANLASHAGPPETTLTAAAVRLETLGRVVARSSLYSTAPVGFAGQPRFVNAVVALETDLAPHALLDALLELEREFGRDRTSSFQNGPRSLDLDILLVGGLVVSEYGLDIPHPRLAERAFVLIPLSEIAPQVVEPKHQKTVAGLLQTLMKNCEGETHAVVPIESDAWRAGAGGNAVIPRGSSRAGADKPDSDC
jgi:2-amino-4-hydroxy-6-hydroxymethyldihydropteridine diphosphokinase